MSSSQVSAAAVREILLAPLHMRSLRWTSDDLAAHLGVSQTVVARAWRRSFAPVDDDLGATVRGRVGELVGVAADTTNVVLVFRRSHRPPLRMVVNFMRQPRRAPFQALLASDLLRSDLSTSRRTTSIWQRLLTEGHDADALVALARGPVPDIPVDQLLTVDDPQRWQQLLADLVVASTETPMTSLRQLQAQVNDWVVSRRPAFEWLAPSGSGSEHGVPAKPPKSPRPLGQALADDAFRVIVSRITSGQLAGGDRITETSMQRALRTSRTQVREAMRILALGGLVHLEPNRGAFVPIPTSRDVIDTYDARLALGRLLVDRAATDPHRDLRAAETALEAMLRIAGTSDARATGDADVRFQDALVSSTAMPQVQAMFRALSSQVMLYTAVLGVKYVYSISEMRRDNIHILEAVKRRDADAAKRAWESKVNAAKDFMAAHLQ